MNASAGGVRGSEPTARGASGREASEWQQLGFLQPSDERGRKKSVVATVQRRTCAARRSLLLRHSSPQQKCCGLVHYLSLICAVSFLLSTLSFSITKKFSNGLEIKFDMKMEDLVICSALSVIGVLGMVPTGCAVRGSRRLKG